MRRGCSNCSGTGHNGATCSNPGVRYYPERKHDWAAEYQANPEHFREKTKNYNLRSLYGLQRQHYEQIIEFQDGRCGCCGREDTGSVRDWNVEHNHTTEQIRGITCWSCNVVLGRLGDTADCVGLAALEFLDYLARAGEFVSDEIADALIAALERAKTVRRALAV